MFYTLQFFCWVQPLLSGASCQKKPETSGFPAALLWNWQRAFKSDPPALFDWMALDPRFFRFNEVLRVVDLGAQQMDGKTPGRRTQPRMAPASCR